MIVILDMCSIDAKGWPVSHLPFLSHSLLPYLFPSPPPLELVTLKPARRSGGAL